MRTRPRKETPQLGNNWYPEPREQSEEASVQARIHHDTSMAYLRWQSGVATVADLQHLQKHGYADQIKPTHFRRALASERLATEEHLDLITDKQ